MYVQVQDEERKKKKLLLIKYEFDLPRLSKLSFFFGVCGVCGYPSGVEERGAR